MAQNYYNEYGTKIRKPSAYAKTGAPMYKTKYDDTPNINEKKTIYKMNLSGGKIYIGQTGNYNKRMNQHFSGNGSKVTQKFTPKNSKIIDSCNGYFANKKEQEHTNKYIHKYGYNNVRGGSYTNSKTLSHNSNNSNNSNKNYYSNNSNKNYYSKKYYDRYF